MSVPNLRKCVSVLGFYRFRLGVTAGFRFKRMRKVVKRQRTILGVVLREVARKLNLPENLSSNPKALNDLHMWIARAERIRAQQRHDKKNCTRCMRQKWSASQRAKPEIPTNLASKSVWLSPTSLG